MKRSAIPARKAPMARGSKPLRSKARIRKVNRKRLAKRRAKQFGVQAELCRQSPCVACLSANRATEPAEVLYTLAVTAGSGSGSRPSSPHHVHTTGAGGGDEETVPLCNEHHLFGVHGLKGHEFWERLGLDVDKVLQVMRTAARGARGHVQRGEVRMLVGDEMAGDVAGRIR